MTDRRGALIALAAVLAGVSFAIAMTVLATRITSPTIGLEDSPVIVQPAPTVRTTETRATITRTVFVPPPVTTTEREDDHGDDDD